jgi:glycerate kinase
MKVICAPDSFKGSLTAVQAAAAMADGIRHAVADAEVDRCPVGDGGEGTLEALLASVPGEHLGAIVSDSFGRNVDASIGLLDDGRTAFVEAAAAIGLGAIPLRERDVMRASSYGVGQLVLNALQRCRNKIIIGIGGSSSNDGGCGMAQALGVRFFGRTDRLIEARLTGAAISEIHRIDTADLCHDLENRKVIVACDVINPFTGPDGAAHVFAPQKGATTAQVDELENNLQHLAELIRRDLGVDIQSTPGAGAAGGLGGGLLAFAGAELVSGIDAILEAVGFEERIQGADLCLTGEGRLDAQSLSGKACLGVAALAAKYKVPTVALVGRAGPGAQQSLHAGITEYVEIGGSLSEEESIRQAASLLSNAAAATTRKYC